MRTLVGLAILLLPAGLLAAPEATGAPKITAHRLTVRFDPPRHRLIARDVLTLQGGAEAGQIQLRLDPALKLSRAQLNGKPFAVSRGDDGSLTIPAPASGPHEVTLAYRGKVYDAVTKADDLAWVVGDNTRGVIGDMGIYLSEASLWVPLPAVRTPARFDVTTIVPAPFVVVTQGGPVRRSTTKTKGFDPASDTLAPTSMNAGDEITWNHAVNPATIPTDGVSLSAGPYVQKSRDVEGVKLSTFFYRRHAAHADLWLDAAEETVRRYAKLIGPLPHTKFDIAENFFQSGYGMPAYTLLGDRVIDYVTAKAKRRGGTIPPGYLDHEYVHCWFGNGLFVDYDTGNWCEALTTYFSNYLARELDDLNEARAYRRGVLEKFAIRVKGEADYPLRKFVTKTEDADNDVGYGKGAMFFHMLRRHIGDDAFFKRVRTFTKEHMGTVVSWDDWLAALDQDGTVAALRPFLERAGVPELGIKILGVKALPEGRAHVAAQVTSTDREGKTWPTGVPVRVIYRDTGGASRLLDTRVEVTDGAALLDVVVEGSPTSIELDPDFDMLRRIPEGALPHCLNRTLASDGPGVVVLDAPPGVLSGLASRIADNKGFALHGPKYDWRAHEGPVVLVRALNDVPEDGVRIGDRTFDDPTVSVVRSWGTVNGPRTEYVALSPDAAKRAYYVTYYGWDSWVTFHNGIPRERNTAREVPSTRLVLEQEGAAAARADQWVRALSDVRRAPGQREALLLQQLERALDGLQPVEIDTRVDFPSHFDVKKSALHYVLGSHQGTLEGRHVRPLCFSGSGTTRWLQGGGLRQVEWQVGKHTPAQLYQWARKEQQGMIVIVDEASWKALAPWVDREGHLTDAAEHELDRPGRDGKPRPRPPSIQAWIAGRRARGGLPSPKPVSVPVLCVRKDVLPQKAQGPKNPLARMEEMSVEVDIEHTWVRGRNLVAWHPPSTSARAPGIRQPVLVLSAHYDSVPSRKEVRYRGADDNASGVACLLEVARNLRRSRGVPHVGIVIALTDAEEWGLYGARALQKALAGTFDVRGVINVDSVGRAQSKPCHVIGQATHPTLAAPVATALATEGIELGSNIDRYAYAHGSDHYPFHEAGIPAVSLWASDYTVMNTVADVPDKVEMEGIARIARALTTLVQSDLSWLMKMR